LKTARVNKVAVKPTSVQARGTRVEGLEAKENAPRVKTPVNRY